MKVIIKLTMIVAVIISLIFVVPSLKNIGNAGSSNAAATLAQEMKLGWNLGNTLDAYSENQDAYEIAQQNRDKYQIMMTYTTKTYSGWDASSTPFLSSDGSEYIAEWKIDKLNSDKKQSSGSFSFQLINQAIEETGSETLDFTVTKAEFKKKDGSIIKLSDIVGKHSRTIKDKVTTYITSDISKQSKLKRGSDVVGGTLTIGIKINKYPMPKSPKITKEMYYETLWGNPITTKTMIDDVKSAGFGAVRIPVTYYNHIDQEGNINIKWLERVKEVVTYVLDNDMYCIINVHHDTGAKGWLRAVASSLTTNTKKFEKIWKQIANDMKEFDNKLLFEGYNELLNNENKWSWADDATYKAANDLNQAFVNTVRSTGGNNDKRILLVNTYASSSEGKEIKSFVLPKDKANDSLIVQVHYYGPTEEGILSVMERLNKNFVSKGIPVIIGESGMSQTFSEADRIKYAKFLVSTAKKNKITVFWWDDGNYKHEEGALSNFGLYDRHALKWKYPKVVDALVSAAK